MSEPRNCKICKRPLPEGVRFCAACGHHDFDPISHIQEGAKKKAKEEHKESLKEWLHGWITSFFD